MLRVVGDTLGAQRRPMAFSMQSIQKRLSSLFAYFVSGALVATLENFRVSSRCRARIRVGGVAG